MDKNTGSSSVIPNLNMSYKRLRFNRVGSRLMVGSQPRQGAGSPSCGAVHVDENESSEQNIVPAPSRMAFTRSDGESSGRDYVPRNDCTNLNFPTMAAKVSQSSVPRRPCS